MKVLNVIWGFTPGGVGKCFLSYCRVGDVEPRLDVVSVCINLENTNADTQPLKDNGVLILGIKNRRDFSWIKRLNALIGHERPDLIFTHGFNGPVVVLLCRLLGGKNVPMVCSYHSEYHPMTRARRPLAPILNGVVHFIYRHFAKAVLGVSSFNLDYLRKCGIQGEKLSYVHNGAVDVKGELAVPVGFPEFGAATIKFLVASRIDAIKGLSSLIEGFALARKSRCDIALIIVGDGPIRADLEHEVEVLGLIDSVRFVGVRNDVANWMAYSDVFCLPSFVESFPIGLIEAMRGGKPSVVSHAGGIPEAVTEDEALFIKAGDATSIASAIERMAGDAPLRARLGASARKRYLANFTEGKMMRGIADWLLKNGGCDE